MKKAAPEMSDEVPDIIAEHCYGPGAQHLRCPAFLRRGRAQDVQIDGEGVTIERSIMLAVLPAAVVGQYDEIWDCELIVIPKKRLRTERFLGYRADQVLACDWTRELRENLKAAESTEE